jgi:ankyrin repeat protein
MVKQLGADVNQPSQYGCTPLHRAAQEGHVDLVLYLVKELGADVNFSDN